MHLSLSTAYDGMLKKKQIRNVTASLDNPPKTFPVKMYQHLDPVPFDTN